MRTETAGACRNQAREAARGGRSQVAGNASPRYAGAADGLLIRTGLVLAVAAAERQIDLGRRTELGLAWALIGATWWWWSASLVAWSRTVTCMRTGAKVSRGAVTWYFLMSVRRIGTCQ